MKELLERSQITVALSVSFRKTILSAYIAKLATFKRGISAYLQLLLLYVPVLWVAPFVVFDCLGVGDGNVQFECAGWYCYWSMVVLEEGAYME